MDARRQAVSEDLARYESVALVLQGGGALGAYQGGVHEGLAAAGVAPRWFAGTSIGAINAAILAGNAPAARVARLREFWELVSRSSMPLPDPAAFAGWVPDPRFRALINQWSATQIAWRGQEGFFTPRVPPAWAWPPGSAGATSLYDTDPLRETLNRLVDWDLLNSDAVRVTVGAVEVETGNFRTFESAGGRAGVPSISADHVMASAALPPAFAPIKIGERHFWDGGLVSNTPLEAILDHEPRRDTLAIQVDLWSARGPLPLTIADVMEREKDIRFSSRTRRGSDDFAARQNLRHRIARVMQALPAALHADVDIAALGAEACTKVMKIVHVIYRDKEYEAHNKDYEFGRTTMNEHWRAGLDDIRATLADARALAWPRKPVETYDLHRDEKLK